MQDFRNLRVWQKSQALVVEVYKVTTGFPKEELYGLTSQTRRAAVSIVANIAEGCGRGSDADFARFLQIAIGSLFEVDALIAVARDLKYITAAEVDLLATNVGELRRTLNAFLQTVKRGNQPERQSTTAGCPEPIAKS